MPRKPKSNSRTPPVTERELALEWELKRIRAEVATLRKQQSRGVQAGQGLSHASRLDLIQKIGRMFRNCVLHRVPDSERCEVCGGMTEAQIEAGWTRWAQEAEEGVERAKAWHAQKYG